MREGISLGKLIMAALLGTALLCGGTWTASASPAPEKEETAQKAGSPVIRVNGSDVAWTDPAIVRGGRTYVPASQAAALFGGTVSWDNDRERLTIHNAFGDEIVLGNGVPVVYYNDARYMMDALPFVKSGRLYAPIRQLAEIFHARLLGDPDTGAIDLLTVEPETVSETNGAAAAAEKHNVTVQQLLQWNGLAEQADAADGTALKVVIPSFADDPAPSYTEDDLLLLAKITMVEAGHEPYEGQLALANVILNRVKDGRFPDTIKGVIYAGKQFPPAHNGMLDKSKPNAVALRAAKDALDGKNNVEGALYFYNPDVTKGEFWSELDVVATIGHHRFAK